MRSIYSFWEGSYEDIELPWMIFLARSHHSVVLKSELPFAFKKIIYHDQNALLPF